MTPVFSFEVSAVGLQWSQTVNAHTPGKAKYEYWLTLRESYPDLPITAMRSRKVGAPQSTEQFLYTARYRRLPEVRCGQRVRVGKGTGAIVGSNSSANFNVLFDLDSPLYPGLTLNVHPQEITFGEL